MCGDTGGEEEGRGMEAGCWRCVGMWTGGGAWVSGIEAGVRVREVERDLRGGRIGRSTLAGPAALASASFLAFSLASLWALVIRLSLIFFMPDVSASISEG